MARFKLYFLRDAIAKILKRWNENSTQKFLEKAKKGTYSQAENDAIELHQLIANEQD
ncbi:MAG: hypothetical protein JW776_04315 [Candidatus Lokiarchaeota archaeon]|nr:hypothetical protein [Candidatus Lokiarchaeota archaeon]